VVDFVLRPEEIARELSRISRHAYFGAAAGDGAEPLHGDDEMTTVFRLLRAHTGSDFANYKRGTIERRLRRRMALRRAENLSSYVAILQEDREEVRCLYED